MHGATNRLSFLLLQVRNTEDPMRDQEVRCFARVLGCDAARIRVHDLLSGAPTSAELQACDAVLLGGSGDYSVVEGGPWLPEALAAMRELCDISKPTFASCWGFQAMARALGGEVVTDPERAELGSVTIIVTEAGRTDPVFRDADAQFLGQQGHQDIVTKLPTEAVLLASSERVENQAFRVQGKPIYCTQFHPELDRRALIERVEAYPQYVEKIAGTSLAEFEQQRCRETPVSEQLLRSFVDCYLPSGR